MAKVIAGSDCGNAPKSKFIYDFLVALANDDLETALGMLEYDARLEIIGRDSFGGNEEIQDIITKEGGRSKVIKLEISKIISHGKHCAANGTMHFEDGGKVAFNNMYTFSSHSKNAKLKLIETYSIVLH